ncbi:MAG: BlaI/MecI/CopY family transcriptional regulator [Trebonia sp.]
MTGKGDLERAVLQVLWDHPEGITARDLLNAIEGKELAMTTILTVLDRLARKGLVTRLDGLRPHRYAAAVHREDYVADLMLDALGQAPDRGAALTRFLGRVNDTDTDHLRRVLRHRRPTAG